MKQNNLIYFIMSSMYLYKVFIIYEAFTEKILTCRLHCVDIYADSLN